MTRHIATAWLVLTLGLCLPDVAWGQYIPAPWISQQGIARGSVTLDTTAGNAVRIQMSTPAAPTMTQNQSGTDLAAGAYATALVALDPVSGVTLPTATQTVTVGAGGAGRIVFTFTFPTGSLTTRAYISAMGGATPDRYFACTASPCNVDTLTGATVAALPTAASAYRTNVSGATANWFANPVYFPNGTAAAPSMTFAGNTNTGFWSHATNVVELTSAGTTVFAASSGVSTGLDLKSTLPLAWSSGAPEAAATDTFIYRGGAAATVQFGANAAGVTNQTLKGPDRITSAGVGGNVTLAGGRGWDTGVGGSLIFQTAPAAGAGVAGVLATRFTITPTGGLGLGASGTVFMSGTAPTIASGGCTSPAVTTNNGTAKFKLTIGTTCTGVKTVTLTLPAAANEWACDAVDLTTNATYRPEQSAAASATSVVITNYARTTGLAIDWADSEVLLVKCTGG